MGFFVGTHSFDSMELTWVEPTIQIKTLEVKQKACEMLWKK